MDNKVPIYKYQITLESTPEIFDKIFAYLEKKNIYFTFIRKEKIEC